ncbi:MAG TPA: signal recognition particle-docking protein FtsY [Thiotrichaceae bacterium]|nr:signal recognition particle-docking protein FtsY [Thiotrichaceae bacterium]
MFGFKKNKKHDDNTEESKPKGLFQRLKIGLSKTGNNLTDGVGSLLLGKKQIDDEILEELETRLLMADVGIEATKKIIKELTQQAKRSELTNADELITALESKMTQILTPVSTPLEVESQQPFVILMVGINGAGKTTTIGKLANKYKQQGKSVILAAGDTFRAAAVEQLQEWGARNDIPVVAQSTGADSASVIFDALQSATANSIDIVIADTAGRLHTQTNLMEELKKVKRVMQKNDTSAPHEVMLVIDAGMGQNALQQAIEFNKALGITGLTLSKLDGTAKGGIIFAIAEQTKIPVRFIGVGEQANDLQVFDARQFSKALLQQPHTLD